MPNPASAFRIDKSAPTKFEITDSGFLKCDAYLTRTGVFEYNLPDGSKRAELRLADEVFSADSLKSFSMLPLTDDHPPAAITSENAKQYQVGHLGETIEREGDLVKARALVTDAATIDKVTAREKIEISCGYTCDLDHTPGEFEGMKYDSIQRNIRGNHVAIVKHGRAGPLARLRLDTAGVMTPDKTEKTMILKFDGVDFDVVEPVAKAIEAERAAAKAELDKATAKADAAISEVEKVRAELAAAPEKVRAEIKARVELENQARKVLGAEAKLDGKDEQTLKVEAIKAMHPDLNLDGKSPAYIDARFDIVCELAAKEGSANEELRSGMRTDASAEVTTASDARKAMLERNAKLAIQK